MSIIQLLLYNSSYSIYSGHFNLGEKGGITINITEIKDFEDVYKHLYFASENLVVGAQISNINYGKDVKLLNIY